jgi:putative SOS response-associated peptidase YedK
LVPAIASDEDGNPKRVSIHRTTWGLKPDWAKSLLINAKAETITGGKRSFWHDDDWRPCLMPADAYYEWRAVEGQRRKQRVAYRVRDEPFTMAGLERLWKTPTGWTPVAVIITTSANELAAAVHSRMPVIIPRERRAEWILGPRDHDRWRELLVPYPASEMIAKNIEI